MLHLDFAGLLSKYEKHNRSGIIHVGAHIGEEVGLYRQLNFAKVLLFEPLRLPFEKISVSDGVYKVNAAVGNTDQIAEMYLADNAESSSLLKPKQHLVAHPNVKFIGTEKVRVTKLDTWFESNEYGLFPHDFCCMVIDAQGYEGEVVRGAGPSVMSQMDVIYAEVSIGDLYEENTKMDQLDDLLSVYNLRRKETWISFDGCGEAIYVKTMI